MTTWGRYHDAVEGKPARPTLVAALAYWRDRPGVAVDLGCGTGRDTLALLQAGWKVRAVDADAEALARLATRVPPEHRPRLEIVHARLEAFPLGTCDLVNASFSLPFCQALAFPGLWMAITAAVAPAGLFAGHLLGDRDEWARRGMPAFRRDEALKLLSDWRLLRFDECENDEPTATGMAKHWHFFAIVARRVDGA